MDNKQKKKKIYLSLGGLIAVVIIFTAASFALWQTTRKQTNFNAIVTACLDLTINNESPSITMDYAYPITDGEGLATSGYSFTVTNNCDQPVSYAIGVESVDDNSGKQFIGNAYIDFSLDGKAPVAYSTLDTVTSDSSANYTIRETRSLAIRQVPANGSRTHTIRMWLDEDTPLTEQNKTFVSKVTLTGGQGIDAGCYSVNSEGLLYDYDSECGTAAVIPASVNGHNITTISSNAFKTLKPGYIISDWDNTYSSTSSLEKGSCNTESGNYQTCKIDFSMVYSDKLEPMYTNGGEGMTQEEIAALLGSLTLDDVYVIIYNTDSSTPQYSHVDEAIDYYIENNIGQMSSLLNFDLDDIERYTYGVDTLPNDGEVAYEQYVSADYRDSYLSWRTRDLGYRVPGGDPVLSLAINSLDLSQATHLNKIEPLAFSLLKSDFSNVESLDTGLTSLTFGNNNRAIEIGGAAFAGANLGTLTIYNSYTMPSAVVDDLITITNPYAHSNIGTLNIVQVGSNTSYSGLPSNYNPDTSDYYHFNIDCGVTLVLSLSNVGNLNIDDNITELYYVPYNASTSLHLPSNLSILGNGAFLLYNGPSLTIPSGVTSIGMSAFNNYEGSGQTLVIPSSVTSIGDGAFYDYIGNSITFNNGLQSIGNYGFWEYDGADITIPSTITSIGGCAFASKTGNININKANGDGITFGQAWARDATVNYIGN